MNQRPKFSRPSFDEAMAAWKALLGQRGFPAECLWVFDENLCFEKDASGPGGIRVAFQTAFSPAPADAAGIAYDSFAETEVRLVFYRIGSFRDKSICAILCDQWFEARNENDGFVRRDEWRMSFRPGANEQVEEVTERERWERRLLRDRPRHDLDFCMPLRAVHELMAHGRVLSTYEHYALKFFHVWWRLLGHTKTPRSPKSGTPGGH